MVSYLLKPRTHRQTHTHTFMQSLSGQEKIKLWFQFVFLSIHCWITDTLNASLYVSDLRKHSQSEGFFPDLKKKNRKKPDHLQYSCATYKKCVKRETSRHTHRARKKYQRRKAKKWFKNLNSSIKDKNVYH